MLSCLVKTMAMAMRKVAMSGNPRTTKRGLKIGAFEAVDLLMNGIAAMYTIKMVGL